MSPRANLALSLALWVVPSLIGIAIASRFMSPQTIPAETTDQDPEDERGFDDALPDPTDRERLQGVWECTLLERDGRTVYRDEQARMARVIFHGDNVTFEDVGVMLQGTYHLDPGQNPKTFDLTLVEGNDAVTYPAAIYELEPGRLRLCFGFPSRIRPTRFETFPGSGQTLFNYRRAFEQSRPDRPRLDNLGPRPRT